ncbi:MAG: hypothetical protein RL469_536 [Pseudomonadota bacterium]|jgi:MFS family permease|nr:MFS transporter [Gammaproteobacteria bacterium]
MSEEPAYPSRAYAWFVVVLLTLAYAISLLDRWILALLVGPVKEFFGATDTQMGLLMGPVFALFYVSMGLPFGWLADRYDRKTMIGGAMLFWCSMTAICGLAKTFGQLAAARLGIGLGEAALTPAAYSLIADYFPRAEQNRAIAFLNMGVATGMGFAYLVGGLIVGWMMTQPPMVVPVLGHLEPWQVVFIAAGLPGIVVGVVVFFIREPVRRERLAATADAASTTEFFAYLKRHRAAYAPLMIGMVASPLVGYALQWLPAMFDRVWGWNAPRFSFAYGWLLLVIGPLSAILGGSLSTRLYRRGRPDGPMTATLAALVLMVVSTAMLPLAPTPEVALLLLVPSCIGGAMSTACGAAAVVFMTPGEFRARVSSLYILTINGFGMLLGPPIVGWLNDHVFHGPQGIRFSVALVVAIIGGVLTAYLSTGRRAFGDSVRALEAAQAARAAV